MGEAKKLALLGACALLVYMLWHGTDVHQTTEQPAPTRHVQEHDAQTEAISETADGENADAALSVPASATTEWEESFFVSSQAEEAVEMTIGNAALIKNETHYEIDPSEIVRSAFKPYPVFYERQRFLQTEQFAACHGLILIGKRDCLILFHTFHKYFRPFMRKLFFWKRKPVFLCK